MCFPSWVVDGPSLTSTPPIGASACRLRGRLSTLWSKVGWLTAMCNNISLFAGLYDQNHYFTPDDQEVEVVWNELFVDKVTVTQSNIRVVSWPLLFPSQQAYGQTDIYVCVILFVSVCTGSAADLCKMAMIRIFNLVSSSSSLSARYNHKTRCHWLRMLHSLLSYS